MERMHEVLDAELVRHAISEVFDVLASSDLTVAESIMVAASVDRTFKAAYPEAYGIIVENAYSELNDES